MTNEQDQLKELKDISSKMDVLIKLTAINTLGSKKKIESVSILTDLGFTEGEIADLLNTTTGSVNRMRQYTKKKSPQPKKVTNKDAITSQAKNNNQNK